uniref:CABIT domain-containing protein n=2 Tax=Plectus sambesii TaxID=2011161 RepID=A0A914W4K7_9BILA
MSAASVSYILTAAKWAIENDLFLEDFVRRFPLPHTAIVTRGQYMTLGVPNIANPTLKPYVMVHSTQKVRKMLAQLVRVKEGKKKVPTEHRVAIPETFRGYFEILSEDGRPIKCLESIMELCQKFPELCLVRQACKAYIPDGDGELRSLYRTRTVHEGEVLTLVGQFNLKRTVFLRCFDEQGGSVYLKLNQKGKFSPVAQPDAITGVHSMENLMNKRLPLTVRLIHGDCPSQLTKVIGNGPLVLQLNSVFIDELAIICSLQREETLFHAVPLKAHIRLAPALNHQQLKSRPEFADVVEQCDSACTDILDRVLVYNDFLLSDTVGGGEEQTVSCPPAAPPVADEEIDQLYDYIRGLAPLPKDSKYNKSRSSASKKHAFKPPPPPIETIPSRKSTHSGSSTSSKVQLQVEIRQHPSATTAAPPYPPATTTTTTTTTTIGNGPPPIGGVSKAARRNSPPTNEPKSNNRSVSVSVDRRSIDRSTVASGRTDARSPPTSASVADRQRRLSQSTDKLAQSPPTRYRVSPPPSSDEEEEPAWKNNGAGPAGRRRPLSMVLPDNVAFYAMQHPYAPMRPPMPPAMAFAPMYRPQQSMYQSMAAMPTSDSEKMAMAGAYGFPVLRSAVYPRYTPRYCHPPVMRHPMYRPV